MSNSEQHQKESWYKVKQTCLPPLEKINNWLYHLYGSNRNYTACDYSLLTIWLSVQIPHKVIYLYHTILCQRICKLTIFIQEFKRLRIHHHSPSTFYYEKKVTIMNKDKIQRRKWYWYAQFCKNESIVHVSNSNKKNICLYIYNNNSIK